MDERGITLSLEPEAEPTTQSDVFYNTEMLVNRDISVGCLAMIRSRFDNEHDDLSICDALAASGIRGLRYLNEVEGIGTLILNDMNPTAITHINDNLDANDVDTDKVTILNQDANRVLTDQYRTLDYVDIDPFGSPAPYLDSAARSLFYESCIGVTATDLAPLFGSYRKVCERRYGSKPLKNGFSHETGLRILIKEVFETLARYDYAFDPLFCHYERHYYRVFGKVRESKKTCNRLRENIGYLSYCRNCTWRAFSSLKKLPETCEHCDSQIERAGPLWTGKFADASFVSDVANWLDDAGYQAAEKLSRQVAEESVITTPYYDTHDLGSVHEMEAPRKQDLIDALSKYGYSATETHFSPTGIRTDAPMDRIVDIIT